MKQVSYNPKDAQQVQRSERDHLYLAISRRRRPTLCVLEEVSKTVVFTRGLNEWRALCQIMYSLSVCSDGPQNRPPARTLSSTCHETSRSLRRQHSTVDNQRVN